MKKQLIRAGLLIGMPALTYIGFLDGVEGALYVVKFFVWAICLPVGLMGFTDEAQKNLAKQPPNGPISRFIARAGAWCSLAMMVWTGHIATAAAWGFFMLCSAVIGEAVKKMRATAEGSAT